MPPAKKIKTKAKPVAATSSTLGGLVGDSDLEDDLSNMSVTRPASVKPAVKKAPAKSKKTKVAEPELYEEEEEEDETDVERVIKRGRPAGSASVAATPSGGVSKVKKTVIKPSRPLGAKAKQALEESILGDTSTASVKVTKKNKVAMVPEPVIEEEEEEEEEEEVMMEPKKKGRQAKPVVPVAKKGKTKRAPEPELEAEDMEVEQSQTELDETQQTGEEEEVTGVSSAPPTPPPAPKTVPASARSKKRPAPGDSDTGVGEVVLRRKLGEMNRKFESLESKYNVLREIGIKEAERNYDKLKKQTEDRVKTSTELIAKLSDEVKIQTELAREAEFVKAELEESGNTVKQLQAKIAALEKSLTDSRAENKNLVTKLAASRSNEISITGTSGKGVGSGALGAAGRTMAASNEMVAAAQMKEDLYGDLTGLIIRGVKRDDTEEVFDCLQTGRNGTLHFKLAIEQEEGGNGEYEEAQFTYRPQLDDNRDGELIDLLPEYLTEDITFPRPHAAKFYTRVSRALMEMPNR